jgi:hypothetical protein
VNWLSNEYILVGRSKGDFISLISVSELFQQCAAVMGLYQVHESCENIRRASAVMDRPDQVAEAAKVVFLSFIKEEIGTLCDTVLHARTAIDLFYKAN